MMPPALRPIAAAAIGVLLVLHAMTWSPSQLLWACHVASALLAVGLVADRPRLVAIGFVFHVGLGIPVFLLDVIVMESSTVTSVLLHTLPLAAGAWALWGRPLPGGVLVRAWLLYPIAMVGAYLLGDPAHNVMLVHAPYEPAAAWFPALWMSWLANAAAALTCLALGWLVVRWGWRRWE